MQKAAEARDAVSNSDPVQSELASDVLRLWQVETAGFKPLRCRSGRAKRTWVRGGRSATFDKMALGEPRSHCGLEWAVI